MATEKGRAHATQISDLWPHWGLKKAANVLFSFKRGLTALHPEKKETQNMIVLTLKMKRHVFSAKEEAFA